MVPSPESLVWGAIRQSILFVFATGVVAGTTALVLTYIVNEPLSGVLASPVWPKVSVVLGILASRVMFFISARDPEADEWLSTVLSGAFSLLFAISILLCLLVYGFRVYSIAPYDAVGIIIAALLSLTTIYDRLEVRAQRFVTTVFRGGDEAGVADGSALALESEER